MTLTCSLAHFIKLAYIIANRHFFSAEDLNFSPECLLLISTAYISFNRVEDLECSLELGAEEPKSKLLAQLLLKRGTAI